jgi:hypothetical protein
MLAQSQEIRCLADLRDFVNVTLCDLHNLQTDAFRMTERILRRGGRPCGIHFCLHGPRSVKFTAIWETDRNQILFYSASGERSLKTQLSEPLRMDRRAA